MITGEIKRFIEDRITAVERRLKAYIDKRIKEMK